MGLMSESSASEFGCAAAKALVTMEPKEWPTRCSGSPSGLVRSTKSCNQATYASMLSSSRVLSGRSAERPKPGRSGLMMLTFGISFSR